jgi:polyisoprenoid-binding protein YceI
VKLANRVIAATVGLLALAGAAFSGQQTYQIDSSHSAATFSVRHLMISNVKGEFGKITGTIVYDADNLAASKVEAVIDATTINTREPKRDAHLKSADFFEVDKYPTITFKSKEFRKTGGKLQVSGDLTMHGVTREVVLDIDGPTPELTQRGSARIGAAATTTISRKDWGLTWNRAIEAGGVTVGDEVKIAIDIEAIRRLEGAPTSRPASK